MSRLIKNTSIIAGATLLSRILGFLRDVVIAYFLGTSAMADIFFVAFRVPNLLRRLFAEGSLTMAFVPIFKNLQIKEGEDSAFCFARSTFYWLLFVLSIITIFAIIFAPYITSLIAPGFKNRPDVFNFTTKLIRICFPYIIFISAVALCMGILNSLGHFASPALAPCILNIVLIASGYIAYVKKINISLALSYGVLLAGILQFLMQQPVLKKFNFSWIGKIDLKHKGLRLLVKLMLPSVFGAAVYQLNIVLNTILASYLEPGSVSYLYYADRLVQFPLGIFGVAVSVAALPDLSNLAAQKDITKFKQTLNQSLYLILFICLPATAGLIGLSTPIIKLLFYRGAFNEYSVHATSLCLIAYGLGLPAFSLVRTLVSSFYALKDTKTPAIIASICLIVNLVSGVLLMKGLKYFGLALAVSISSWVNVLLLSYLLFKKIGQWIQIQKKLFIFNILSLFIYLSCLKLSSLNTLSILSIPLIGGLYLFICSQMGIEEAMFILRFLKKTK